MLRESGQGENRTRDATCQYQSQVQRLTAASSRNTNNHNILQLETVSIAEPLQNRQHARETPNAVNTRRERE